MKPFLITPEKVIDCAHDVRAIRVSYNRTHLLAYSQHSPDISIVSRHGNLIGISQLPVAVETAAIDDSAQILYYRTNIGYSYLRSFDQQQDVGLPSYTDCIFTDRQGLWGVRTLGEGAIIEKLQPNFSREWCKQCSIAIDDHVLRRGGTLLNTYRANSVAIVGVDFENEEIEVAYRLYIIEGTDVEKADQLQAKRLRIFDQFLPVFAPHGSEIIGLGKFGVMRATYPFEEILIENSWPVENTGRSLDNIGCYVDDVRVLVCYNEDQLALLHTRSLEFEAWFTIKGFSIAVTNNDDEDEALQDRTSTYGLIAFDRLGDYVVFLFINYRNNLSKLVMVPVASFTAELS